MNVIDPSKELRLLLAFFGESELPHCREVAGGDVPEPFHSLLVHTDHMTVTLEKYHGGLVSVHPYQVHRHGDVYGRKLDLMLVGSDRIVMTGIMLFNLSFATPKVRDLIIEQKTPLGRILIENNVLRQISTTSFLEIDADDPLVKRLHMSRTAPVYGRLATIFCDGKPAVDLLEIVNPERGSD